VKHLQVIKGNQSIFLMLGRGDAKHILLKCLDIRWREELLYNK
jgi:hypothetical protein